MNTKATILALSALLCGATHAADVLVRQPQRQLLDNQSSARPRPIQPRNLRTKKAMKTKAPQTVYFRLCALLLSSTFAYADTLYVSNYGNNTIEEFSQNGSSSLFANSGLNAPMGLAFDNSGSLYVANYGTRSEEHT